MKYVTYLIFIVGIVLIVINAMKLDFSDIFHGDSLVALISIVAVLCGLCLFAIFRMSKSIDEKTK
ncbi:MAG TPA: hypothetical protein VKY32_02390 [Flavobacterium sp.]|nr:hypothetical protein [Flavobacterium sp.]